MTASRESVLTALLLVTIATAGLVDASKCTKVVKEWGTCGGLSGAPKGVKGVTGTWAGYCCATGTTCVTKTKYYSQCTPVPGPSPPPAVRCGAGERLAHGKCVECPVGTWASVGANKCTTCPSGTQSPKGGATNYCEQCSYNHYSRAGHTCKPCPKGTYTMEMGSVGCNACKTRMALDAPGSSCNDYYICAPGKTTEYHFCPGEMDCYWPQRSCCTDRRNNPLVCNGSVLLPPNQLRFATTCPAGQKLVNGVCEDCLDGTYSKIGAKECTPCPVGTQSAAGVKDHCPLCPFNTYNNVPGESCKLCPNGQYNLKSGSTSATDCEPCDTKMAVSGPGSACADYIICEPGKPSLLKYCPEPQCFAPFQSCCASSYDRDGNGVCAGASVLA